MEPAHRIDSYVQSIINGTEINEDGARSAGTVAAVIAGETLGDVDVTATDLERPMWPQIYSNPSSPGQTRRSNVGDPGTVT
ncbi:jg20200 [Pararge aegeria aegeria]|uniref:Jg20200 protein n=1 Tax=Pararge aegeria aegeria TaxID=348720 RepID=A0A8S4RZ95_9NEOP|nr:jg20200 [Pararge aegeria aegeria]